MGGALAKAVNEKIERFLKGWVTRRSGKPFAAWQIELTTRCPLRCAMCIRTAAKDWRSQDMTVEQFKKILPYLKDVETVILEGWGESLLHKDLVECVRLVKREGPEVGFVTSGKGLDRKRVSELVSAGLDFVGFSIAGTTPETHARIRVHSDLSEIQEAVRLFGEEKSRRGILGPKLHLVFLMLKDNIEEVPLVPLLAKEMGVQEVFLTNLCHVMSTSQEEQRVFVCNQGMNDYEKLVGEAESRAKRLKIKLKRPSLSALEAPVCEENPLKNLYISVDGEVSPCVYLYPPLSSPFKRIFCGREYWVEKVSYGNVFQMDFSTLWNSSPYVDFRARFAVRDHKSKELFFSLLEGKRIGAISNHRLPEPPDPCKSCHKILGV